MRQKYKIKSYRVFRTGTMIVVYFLYLCNMKKRRNLYCLIAATILLCGSCKQQPIQQFEGTAFGTIYHITYIGERSENLPQKVDSVLRSVNSTFSIFDTNSLVSRINKGEDLELNDDLLKILKQSLAVNKETDGAFECTIQPLVELWGFGRDNSKQVVSQQQIDSVKEFVGSQSICIVGKHIVKQDPRTQLNFNATAKGFAVDKVAQFLKEQGYDNGLVEIGGEIVAWGDKNGKPWKIGIQKPTETADGPVDSREQFELNNRAVATSGNYRNFFEKNGHRYTHLLNPVTGKPEETNLLSVTVIAPDCATADAYATAFMVLGLDRSAEILQAHKELEAWFIYSDGKQMKQKKITNN